MTRLLDTPAKARYQKIDGQISAVVFYYPTSSTEILLWAAEQIADTHIKVMRDNGQLLPDEARHEFKSSIYAACEKLNGIMNG
jgi:hypothetical protein